MHCLATNIVSPPSSRGTNSRRRDGITSSAPQCSVINLPLPMRPVRAVHTVQLSARLARPRPLPKSRTTPRHFSLSIPPSSASSSFLFTTPSTKTSVLTAGSRSQVEASDILGAKGFSSQCRRSVMFDDEVLPNRFELPGPEGTLEELCEVLHSQVDAFLDSEPSTGLLQDVQNQVRTSLKILDETFNRYRSGSPFSTTTGPQTNIR